MLTVDEVKQLLQIPDGPLATGFYTASGSSIGYGSPVLASRNGLIDKAENKKPYPNGYKFYGTVIAPIAQRDEGTGLAAGSLFTRTIVTRQTVKLWEEDSFINYLEVNAIDDISEINYFKSLPDALGKRGMLCIVPNNMKAVEQLVSAGRELINAYNFSMIYSYDARVAMESVGGNSAYYFQSGLRRSKYTVLIPLLLIIDIKYCIPFYDFNSNTGLLYAWQFFVMNGERAERCSNFSFFVSSTEEGITVVDSERVFDSVETVKDIYFEDWLSKALTTMPFLPSLIETKNKKKPEKILQSRSKKKLKTATIKISKDVSPKLKSASNMSVDVYEEVAKAKEPHEIKNMMSDSHEELFYKTRGIEQPIEQPIEAMKVSMPRTARNKPIRLNPYDEDRFRKNLKGPKCSTSKSEMTVTWRLKMSSNHLRRGLTVTSH
ncbi:MAG: hypothetical protein DRO87_07785 [Candidatus Thorarchaeota archaeon]|nr:MAG: hypothetical protein DRO87_07785 [Candidatus Thorarchaeota archaeon]